jgi:hypothetical protein
LGIQLQQAQGIEGLGERALTLGADLGKANVNTTGANALFQGGNAAAQTLGAVQGYNPVASTLMGLSQNPQFTQAAGQWTSGLFNSQPSPYSLSSGSSGMGLTMGGGQGLRFP